MLIAYGGYSSLLYGLLYLTVRFINVSAVLESALRQTLKISDPFSKRC
jgi:hypothetical protein